MKISFAIYRDTPQVITLFERNLSRDNDAIYSEEFFCPSGVTTAIRRKQIIVAVKEDNTIAAAARFYRRKKQRVTSLYQFAVDIPYRGKGLLIEMLELIRNTDIVVLCPKTSLFNDYYKSTGWKLEKSDGNYNHWYLPSRNTMMFGE